jgi:hypothetical protein
MLDWRIPGLSLNPCVPLRAEFIMTKRKCLACGEYFKPWPQTPDQSYCSKAECQRERRRRTKQKERSSNSVSSTLQHSAMPTGHQNYVKLNRPSQKRRTLPPLLLNSSEQIPEESPFLFQPRHIQLLLACGSLSEQLGGSSKGSAK